MLRSEMTHHFIVYRKCECKESVSGGVGIRSLHSVSGVGIRRPPCQESVLGGAEGAGTTR